MKIISNGVTPEKAEEILAEGDFYRTLPCADDCSINVYKHATDSKLYVVEITGHNSNIKTVVSKRRYLKELEEIFFVPFANAIWDVDNILKEILANRVAIYTCSDRPEGLSFHFTIEMNRPINKETDFLSFGGFEMEFEGIGAIQFDFETSAGKIDDDNRAIAHFELTNPDFDCFPEMIKLAPPFKVTKVIEFYDETSGDTNDVPYPVKLVEAYFKFKDIKYPITDDVLATVFKS